MESDVLFRHIVGYVLATFSAILILVVAGRIIHMLLQNVFHISISFINVMKRFPSFLVSMWLRIKDYIIIACALCVVVLFVAFMFHDCYGHSDNKYYSSEEYEDALDDGKWKVPSRYRD